VDDTRWTRVRIPLSEFPNNWKGAEITFKRMWISIEPNDGEETEFWVDQVRLIGDAPDEMVTFGNPVGYESPNCAGIPTTDGIIYNVAPVRGKSTCGKCYFLMNFF